MKNSFQKIVPTCFLLLYLLLLVKLVVFRGTAEGIAAHFRNFNLIASVKTGYSTANFIPFKTLYYYLSLQEKAETGFENIGGNILLFIPLGFLLPLTFESLHSFRRMILFVFLPSLFFEILQLLLSVGNFDVDDLFLNTLGGAIGFALFYFVVKRNSENKLGNAQ